MGKTKITTKENDTEKKPQEGEVKKGGPKASKKKVTSGIVNVEATFNNTKVLFADKLGNAVFASSSGALGFRGAKKGTPFAASKVGDVIGSKMASIGVKDIDVVVKGVGSGREPAIRAIMAYGMEISSIKDKTPVPHNGPKPKKPRRV
ncbi:MAG: 30S ribosomal protein S11 [Candidatus Pacebacteria bacterium]|nr:30S ribosomal protein S11 [Candidatus Paceibacterota bacterium]MCF7862918.1 30S ribosomal protein S11 [Candidatus Paceibacterota bacterium]